MIKFITLKPMEMGGYRVLEPVDSIFCSLYEILDIHFYQKKLSGRGLIDWLSDEKETSDGNEFVDIFKERNAIALYDVSDGLDEEVYISIDPDPTKRFEMSRKNFAEILYQWEELRVSQLDIILVVIHEDNHVSLETDPTIIKEYQDAGYAFDINKE